MSAPHILVVDDEPDIRNLVQEILEDEGYEVETAGSAAAARQARRQRRPDLVLLDIWMPDVDGVTLLKEWTQEGALNYPVVMMSGHGTVETAVEATRLGAYDFIEKPLSLAKLLLTVDRALQADQLARENAGLRARSDEVIEPVGRSQLMRELREQVKRVAGHDSWVLITGEAGAGKSGVARYLHANSARAGGPFVDLSAGSLSGDKAALELFGSEDGGRLAHGALEQANNGTLFLAEVADLDLQAQARLLSALHSRQFHRLGGDQPVEVNVRIIAATRVDLEREVQTGRFREDLYYHLNVVPIRVPPLREHVEDVPELLTFYVNRVVDRDKLPYRRFTLAAQNRLRNHTWPGNVRELQNLVQRLLILGKGEEISMEEVEAALGNPLLRPSEPSEVLSDELTLPLDLPLREAREQFERLYLQHQLKKASGSVGQLAKLTGMERTHLYRKLKALGIDPKDVSES
jgi:two-component system nitrogen regulation response regulator NtrX